MARPVAGSIGYDATADRPTVDLQSGTKTLLTEDDAVAPAPASSGGAYTTAPSSPNAFNDEFASGSADLATRGWTFRRATSVAGTMTRVGEIYPRRTIGSFSTLTTYQYRSSIVDGRMHIQLPLGTCDYTLTKAVSVPVTSVSHGGIVWGRFSPGMGIASTIGLAAVGFFANSGGFADLDNFIATGEFHSAQSTARSVYRVGGAQSQVDTTYTTPRPNVIPDIKITTAYATASNLTCYSDFATSAGGAYQYYAGFSTSLGVASNMAHAGFWFNPQNASPTAELPFDFVIDFARLHTGDLAGVWIGGL